MDGDAGGRRRLRRFGLHLGAYFVAAGLAGAANLMLTPGDTWALLVIVGWSPVITLHAAHAMGLFEVLRRG